MEKMKRNSPQNIILAIVIVIFVVVISTVLINSVSIEINDGRIRIKGIYGTEMSIVDIVEIKKLESVPFLGIKTNGIGLGFINIGFFTYKGIGKVRLFEIKKDKPYILIIGQKEQILLGLGKEKNEEIYSTLEREMASNKK